MPKRPTYAVCPVWDALEHVENLIDDLEATVPDLPVVFVDNASERETAVELDLAVARNKHWTLVRNEQNLGFTAAVNQGIVEVGPGYDILFLNTDIRFGPLKDGEVQLDPDWLDKLSAWLERYPEVGLVSPRLQNRDGAICGPEAVLADDGRAWLSHVYPKDRGQLTRTRVATDLQYACVLKSAEAIESTGLLEEGMAIYRSDSYDCRMVQLYGKQRLLVAGDVTLTHWVGASRSQAMEKESEWTIQDQRVFCDLLPAVNGYRNAINLHGPFGEMTGYSKLCENIARSLRAVDVKVLGQTIRKGLRPDTINRPLIQDIVDQDEDPSLDTLIVCPPHEATFYRGRKRTCATMFECWQVPQPWVPMLNAWEECWTFTDWNKRSFQSCGVDVPIKVCPTPVDTDFYHPELDPIRLRQKREFNVLTMFEWGVRKNPQSILQVCRAFAGHDDVAMVCRVNGHDGGQQLVKMIASLPQRDVPIITPEPVPEYDMGSFYRAFDLVIAVGAEGIGLACLEALACGVPVIALNWGPGAEFAKRYGATLVDPVGERDVTGLIGPLYDGAIVGVPDMDHLARLVQWHYHHRDEAKQAALCGAEGVARDCSLEVCGMAYYELLFGGAA